MDFGTFYSRICEQLKTEYGWRGPVMYLAVKPELINIVHDEYSKFIKQDNCDEKLFQAVIESTCLKIDQFDMTESQGS